METIINCCGEPKPNLGRRPTLAEMKNELEIDDHQLSIKEILDRRNVSRNPSDYNTMHTAASLCLGQGLVGHVRAPRGRGQGESVNLLFIGIALISLSLEQEG